jgi:hypothetical protein
MVAVPEQLATAPAVVVAEGMSLRLYAYPWRNLMPGPDRNSSRLAVSFGIAPDSGTSVPNGLIVERAWVVWEEQAWAAYPKQAFSWAPPAPVHFVARGVPYWPPGSEVDVLVQFRTAAGDRLWLAARDLTIDGPQ